MVANIQGRAVSLRGFLRSRRIAIIVVLVPILFLFRPGVYKLRNRIATSIGNALGRRVELNNVRLRLLPRPGFDLEGLIIYDDPAVSAEPMIRAQAVSAAIRFRSLLRGRLEIATLSATEPSINLVRSNEGRWNLASLIERNAQIPAAPTAKSSSERRPAFPYLEATSARINFKLGATKKSYALINADVALWQDSENSWGARMKAEPVRTDFNLTDTGVLQINASWQRASSLRFTPLQIAFQWRNGQLGQITKLFTGKDRGWRGGMNLTANLTGTADDLRLESQTTIDGFHRYDIVGSDNVPLKTGCSGRYNAINHSLTDLLCESPVQDGVFRLVGSFALTRQPVYDLRLRVEKVPLASAIRLLQQAKKLIPPDMTATGVLNAECRATRGESSAAENSRDVLWGHFSPNLTGGGTLTNAQLSWNSGIDHISFGNVLLTLIADTGVSLRASDPLYGKIAKRQSLKLPESRLKVGPVALALNDSPPLEASGWISRTGYQFSLRGDSTLKDLFRLENVAGLPLARPAAEGAATLDVTISGPWRGFAATVTQGTIQLRNVHAEVHGINTPIEISSSTMMLSPDTVAMQKISARTGTTHWTGSAIAPRHCAIPVVTQSGVQSAIPNCIFQFDLTADQLSTADLVDWFAAHPSRRPWYRILEPGTSDSVTASPLLAIQAHGVLHVARMGLKKLLATQLTSEVDVDRGRVSLNSLHAQLLQGTHYGNWTLDFSNHDGVNGPVQYRGTGRLRDISLSQMSALWSDAWITGLAEAEFEVSGSANSFRELPSRSTGKLQFIMRNGSLPHIEFPGAGRPLIVHRFAGALGLKNDSWEMNAGKLESRDGVYQVSGTLAPKTGFDFVVTGGDEVSWTLTGTLAQPHLSPANRTNAEVDVPAVKP